VLFQAPGPQLCRRNSPQLAGIKVQKGARVRAGDVVAELSAVELTAAVAQARAALDAAIAARAHEIAALAAEIAKARSKLFVYNAVGKEEAMAFLNRDPFAQEGVFADCELLEWLVEGVNPDLLASDFSSGTE
jgi:multidrug resistance efflux pump